MNIGEERNKLSEFILDALYGKGDKEIWMLQQIVGVTDGWFNKISTNKEKLKSHLTLLTIEDLTYWIEIISCSFDTGKLEYK